MSASGRNGAGGFLPQAPEQSRDDDVLVGFRELAERDTRLARFQQHCIPLVVRVEQTNGRIAVPNPQALQLVRALHVRHAELEHRARSIPARRRRDPRAAAAIERSVKR
jgi:hypothetical protein